MEYCELGVFSYMFSILLYLYVGGPATGIFPEAQNKEIGIVLYFYKYDGYSLFECILFVMSNTRHSWRDRFLSQQV